MSKDWSILAVSVTPALGGAKSSLGFRVKTKVSMASLAACLARLLVITANFSLPAWETCLAIMSQASFSKDSSKV